MKSVFLILFSILFLIFFTSLLPAQWIQQNSGTISYLYDVKFINKFTGWICGEGTILKTTNSGTNWEMQPHNANNKTLYEIHNVNESIHYTVGWFETILKSTNGGLNWMEIRNGPWGMGQSYFATYFIDENTGWIGGSGSKILKTTNGGLTFDSTFISVAYIQDIYFRSPTIGLLCGFGGHVRKTTDGGLNWLGVNIPLNGALSNFEKISVVGDYCWLVGNDNRVFRSTDFGSNWILADTIDQVEQLYCSEFSSINTGWAGGSYGKLWKTTDSGFTWLREDTGNDQRFFGSMFFYDNLTGWGVGGAGKIMHTTTGGQTLASINNESEAVINFQLMQNFPNPFNNETRIEFSITESDVYKIEIFDILGRLKETLLNGHINKGMYKIKMNAANLNSGIYIYRLSSSKKSITRKFILMK